MKAITLKHNGGPENFIVDEVPAPKIKDSEVLVKVKAISVNPVDTFVRQTEQVLNHILRPVNGKDKFILGWDISGTVTEVGSEVTDYNKGDEVFGMINFPGDGSAYAEYVAAPATHLALKPTNIAHDEAAAATLAALTAWQALVTYANVKKGEKVLIHAAGGGVGHYAVQIAKYLGAYVIGTGSAAKREFVLGLGADEFIDYKAEKFEDKVKDADMVLDAIPGDHLLRSLDAVKTGGRVISIKGSFEGEVEDKAKNKAVFTKRMMVHSNGDDMKAIAKLLESGNIRSHVSATYKLDELPKAHEAIEAGHTQGKIVVEV